MKRILLATIACLLGLNLTLTAQNLLTNGDFENWDDDTTPTGWKGEKTSFPESGISKSTEAQNGRFALNLLNASTSHKRFTTLPITLQAGTSYTFEYYTKGHGEIRNAFFDNEQGSNGYSTYSEYTTLSSSTEWTKIAFSFTPGEESLTGNIDCQVIISIRSTTNNAIQIDNVSLIANTPTSITDEAHKHHVLHPTLFSNQLMITNSTGVKSVKLYTATGQLALQYNIKGNESIPTGQLKSGVYIAVIFHENNQTSTQKVVKQ